MDTLAFIRRWVEERIDLSGIQALIRKKTVPVHRHSLWYYLGGMTLFLFIVQFLTGTLLMLYYRPSAEGAFESVQFIMTQVAFGWLIRSIHSWAANLLVFMAFAHMFSVFFMKAYRKPRELTWVSGFFCFSFFSVSDFPAISCPGMKSLFLRQRSAPISQVWCRLWEII